MGFWFQLSSAEQQKAENPMGPANPQALNRYSYVLNNPLRYTDPTGHDWEEDAAAWVLAGVGIVLSAPEVAAVVAAIGLYYIAECVADSGCLSVITDVINSGITGAENLAESLRTSIVESRKSHQGGWQTRSTSNGNIKVRGLSDKEVRDRGLHQDKQGRGYGGTDSYYIDKEGRIYLGNDRDELEQEK